jgi:hypothetical protein
MCLSFSPQGHARHGHAQFPCVPQPLGAPIIRHYGPAVKRSRRLGAGLSQRLVGCHLASGTPAQASAFSWTLASAGFVRRTICYWRFSTPERRITPSHRPTDQSPPILAGNRTADPRVPMAHLLTLARGLAL